MIDWFVDFTWFFRGLYLPSIVRLENALNWRITTHTYVTPRYHALISFWLHLAKGRISLLDEHWLIWHLNIVILCFLPSLERALVGRVFLNTLILPILVFVCFLTTALYFFLWFWIRSTTLSTTAAVLETFLPVWFISCLWRLATAEIASDWT